MNSPRLPRFKRCSVIPSLQLTDRDREIVKCVGRHRFLRSTHVAAMVAGSHQQIIRRLQRLYHHGFLERPRCQIDYYQSGSRQMVYGLGYRGTQLLSGQPSLPLVLESRSSGTIGRLFLEHALEVSDFMVALETACRAKESVRLIRPQGIETPQGTATRPEVFRWSVNIARSAYSIVPDAVFGLESDRKIGETKTSWFCVEVDRATMPVKRNSLDKSSFYRKLLAYQATWKQQIHRDSFGWQRFRVLTVTTSRERVQHMLDACKRLKSGHGLFLFTDSLSLESQSEFFSVTWQTTRGSASLLD